MFSHVSIVTLELAREQLCDSLEQDVTLSQFGNIISQPSASPNPYLLIYISKIFCSQSSFSFFSQAFAPVSTFGVKSVSTTSLEACRSNAKKEKRQRNRENMRKFQKRGKISRKKMMRKVASSEARQLENEFIAKCFLTVVDEEKK